MTDGIEVQPNPTIGSPEFRLESARRMAADSIAEVLAYCATVEIPTVDPIVGPLRVPRTPHGVATSLRMNRVYSTLQNAGIMLTPYSTDMSVRAVKARIQALVAKIPQNDAKYADLLADLASILNRVPENRSEGNGQAKQAQGKQLSGAKLVNALRQSVVIGHGEGRLVLPPEVSRRRLGYCDRAKLIDAYQKEPSLHQGLILASSSLGTMFGDACRKSARQGVRAVCSARGTEYDFFTNDSAGFNPETESTYKRQGAEYTAHCATDGTVTVTPGKRTDITGIAEQIRTLMVESSLFGVQKWRADLLASMGALKLEGEACYVPPAEVARFDALQRVWQAGFRGQTMTAQRATADSCQEWRQNLIINLQTAMSEIRNEIAGMKAGHGLEGKVRVRLLASLDAATKETSEFAQVFGCSQDVAPILAQASEIRALFVAGDTRETIEQRLWACELD